MVQQENLDYYPESLLLLTLDPSSPMWMINNQHLLIEITYANPTN